MSCSSTSRRSARPPRNPFDPWQSAQVHINHAAWTPLGPDVLDTPSSSPRPSTQTGSSDLTGGAGQSGVGCGLLGGVLCSPRLAAQRTPSGQNEQSIMNDTEPVGDSEPAVGRKAAVDLHWIPLGAGAHVVRISGKLFEALSALVARRSRCDLYHSALVISTSEGQFVIEQAPVPDLNGQRRGVVAEGPVGMRWLGRFRLFRYEIRLWREGRIPDIDHAIGSPVRVTDDVEVAGRILETLPSIPTPVWAVTNSTRAKCGTRTRLSPGSWRAVEQASKRSIHRQTVGRPDGTRALRSLHEVSATTGHNCSWFNKG